MKMEETDRGLWGREGILPRSDSLAFPQSSHCLISADPPSFPKSPWCSGGTPGRWMGVTFTHRKCNLRA